MDPLSERFHIYCCFGGIQFSSGMFSVETVDSLPCSSNLRYGSVSLFLVSDDVIQVANSVYYIRFLARILIDLVSAFVSLTSSSPYLYFSISLSLSLFLYFFSISILSYSFACVKVYGNL